MTGNHSHFQILKFHFLQFFSYFQAIQARHLPVQQAQIKRLALQVGCIKGTESRATAGGNGCFHIKSLKQGFQILAAVFLIIHNQRFYKRKYLYFLHVPVFLLGVAKRYLQHKLGSLPFLTGYRNNAAHHMDKIIRNSQTQATAGGAIFLLARLIGHEHSLQIFLGNTTACISDSKFHINLFIL